MHYLIYVSQAEHPMSADELTAILTKSRDWNHSVGITGLLIYKDWVDEKRGNFMQLLEGPKNDVVELFEKIVADPRHHTKLLLEDGPIAERTFPDWSMGFRNVEDDALETVPGYSDLGSDAFWSRARAGLLTGSYHLMRSFYETAE